MLYEVITDAHFLDPLLGPLLPDEGAAALPGAERPFARDLEAAAVVAADFPRPASNSAPATASACSFGT